jgi:hypothetical protein
MILNDVQFHLQIVIPDDDDDCDGHGDDKRAATGNL